MMPTDEQLEAAARAVLGLVAHQVSDGDWWGDDHNIGTDAEIVGEAVEILKRILTPDPYGREGDLDRP